MKANRKETGTLNHLLLLLLLFVWTSLAAVPFTAAENERRAPFPLSTQQPLALTQDSVQNKECREHSQVFLKDLEEMKIWAVKMYDASGKVSSGTLRGNVHWLGDDAECLSVSSKPGAGDEDADNIRGQYCSVGIYAHPIPKQMNGTGDGLKDLFDLMHTNNALRNNYDERVTFFPSFSPFSLGVCIPHSCTSEDLKAGMMDWLTSNGNKDVDIKLQLGPKQCMTGGSKKLKPMAIFTLTFYALMTLMGIGGYFYEKRKEKKLNQGKKIAKEGKLTQVLLAFSFRSNLKSIFDTSAPMDEIGCIHGIRFFFSMIIYLLHKWFFALHMPIANRDDAAKLMTGPLSMIYRSFWSNVDTFVVMSGLLTSYYAFKRLQDGKKLNIFQMYLQRYLKFTPLLVVGVLWTAYLLEHMITESLYLRTLRCFIDSCQDGFFNILTYTNSFRGLDNMCFPHAHQLETDMHMYLLAPFLVLFLWKMKLIAVAAIIISMVALSLHKYQTILSQNLATVVYYSQAKQLTTASADKLYLTAFQRLVPYFSGILLGYILRVRNKEFRLPRVVLVIGNAAALYFFYYNVFGLVHAGEPGYVYDVVEQATFGMIQPVVWGCAICWFIYTCATGQAETINQFLRWKGFMVTSRLAFAFYLAQIPVIMVLVGRTPTPHIYSLWQILDLNCLAYVFALTVWLTALFVMPMGKLWAIFNEPAPKAEINGNEVKKE